MTENETDAETETENSAGETNDLTVAFRGLAVGGSAVGRVTGPDDAPEIGMTAFVPFVAPGEVARVTITRREKRFLEGSVAEILTVSPDRVEPRCPHFGVCGGCDLQHMSGDSQRRAKFEMVQSALVSGGLSDFAERLEPMLFSENEYGYRRRIALHVGRDGRAAYYSRRSHDALVPTDCPIADDTLRAEIVAGIDLSPIPSKIIGELLLESADNGVFATARLRVRLDGEGRRPLARTVATRSGTPPAWLIALGDRLSQRFAGGVAVFDGYAVAFGAPYLERDTVRDSPGIFSQANASVNALLVESVLAQADGFTKGFDFYSGAGNFALPLAARGLSMVAVESVPELVSAGVSEARRHGILEQVRFVQSDVGAFLKGGISPDEMPGLVVADPPRSGLEGVAAQLTFGDRLVLISCHLASGVRDLANLKKAGWKLSRLAPFDMFPQTAQLELLSVWER